MIDHECSFFSQFIYKIFRIYQIPQVIKLSIDNYQQHPMQQKTQDDAINFEKELPQLNIQQFKCQNNKQAVLACVDQKCQNSGLICFDVACKCKQTHSKCHFLMLGKIVQGINKRYRQIPRQKVNEIHSSVFKIIDKLIDQLSQIRYQIQEKQKYFWLDSKEIEIFQLVGQSKTQLICGKMICRLEPVLQKQMELIDLSVAQIQQDFNKNVHHFQTICYQLRMYTSYKKLVLQSKIATTFQQTRLLSKWICQESKHIPKKIYGKLLYRASDYNFSVSKFHQLCDNHYNTLLLVKTQFNKTIGGFNPNIWKGYQGQKLIDETGKTFIFSLTLHQKYKSINKNVTTTYKSDHGPIFGDYNPNGDIQIKDNAKQNGATTDFPNCYNRKYNLYQKNQKSYTNFLGATSGKSVKLKQWQIYKIQGIQ